MQTPGMYIECPICGGGANSIDVYHSGMCSTCRNDREREDRNTAFNEAVESIMRKYNCSKDAAIVILKKGN